MQKCTAIRLYTVGQKKRATLLVSVSWSIFKIFLLAHSADNLQ